MESKDLEMLVKDGSTGLKIRERCRGLLWSVRLSNQESVWLLDIFDDLVAAKDSRVFKDQSKPGFPCVLAQHCFNRHGGFLVIEEYDGRERCGSVLIPSGNYQLYLLTLLPAMLIGAWLLAQRWERKALES